MGSTSTIRDKQRAAWAHEALALRTTCSLCTCVTKRHKQTAAPSGPRAGVTPSTCSATCCGTSRRESVMLGLTLAWLSCALHLQRHVLWDVTPRECHAWAHPSLIVLGSRARRVAFKKSVPTPLSTNHGSLDPLIEGCNLMEEGWEEVACPYFNRLDWASVYDLDEQQSVQYKYNLLTIWTWQEGSSAHRIFLKELPWIIFLTSQDGFFGKLLSMPPKAFVQFAAFSSKQITQRAHSRRQSRIMYFSGKYWKKYYLEVKIQKCHHVPLTRWRRII